MIRKLQALIFTKLMKKQAVATSATGNSTSLDTLGKGDTLFILDPTTISGGATSMKIQHSSDDSTWEDLVTWTAVPGDTDDGKLFGCIVTRDKTAHNRYLRGQYVHSGSGSAVLELTAIHDNASEFPRNAADAGFDGGLTIS